MVVPQWQRPAVAPNVHRGTANQRAQFRKVEVAGVRDGSAERTERRTSSIGNLLSCGGIRRAGREDDPDARVAARESDYQRFERLAWPTAKRVARADVNND
jgi:hypothetical protein